jgi:outer membrane protein assembly factor BamB
MSNRAQLFTLDLLLALVPITIILGMSANAMSGVATQVQDYVLIFSSHRTASDIADILIKTPGKPEIWDSTSVEVLGFASKMDTCEYVNATLNHILDPAKLEAISSNISSSQLKESIKKLSGGYNLRIQIINSSGNTKLDIMGVYQSGELVLTNDSASISSNISSATRLDVAERVIGLLNVSFGLKWKYQTGGRVMSSPLIVDLYGDGNKVVFGSHDNNVYALNSDGTKNWSTSDKGYSVEFSGNNYPSSSPAYADLDDDGFYEIIVGSTDEDVYSINHDGSLAWSYEIGSPIFSSPAVGDVGGETWIVIGAGDTSIPYEQDDKLVILNTTGQNYSQWKRKIVATPVLEDVSNDGDYDIIVGGEREGSFDDYIEGFTNGWPPISIWSFALPTPSDVISSAAVYDVDDDGIKEVIVGSDNDVLYALNGDDGSSLWNFTAGDRIRSSPALADIDEDGKKEVIFGSDDDKIYAVNSEDGSLLWSYETGGDVRSSPAIADVDGDCKLEVIIGSNDHYLYILNHDGTLRWRYATGGQIISSPAVADLDGDGILDIAVGSNDNYLYVFNTMGSGSDWPMFRRNNRRTGVFIQSGTPRTDFLTGIETGKIKVYVWK